MPSEQDTRKQLPHKNPVLLVIASPTTRGAGAFQFWEHLIPSLEERGARVVILRGHSDADTLGNQPWSLKPKNIHQYKKQIATIIAQESITHVITSISQSDILFGINLIWPFRDSRNRMTTIPWYIFTLGQPYPVKRQCNPVKSWVWKNLWLITARRSHGIYTVSNYLNRLVSNQIQKVPVNTIYPGLQDADAKDLRSHDKRADASRSIGFVGRLSPEKDPTLYCEITANLEQYDSHVFGDGEIRTHLEHKYPNVRFHGFTEQGSIYSKIDYMLITSHSEGLPTIIMEASEAGVIPIVADVGGCSEAIHPRNRDLLVVPLADRTRVSEWQERIHRISLTDEGDEIIKRQRAWISEKFRISKTAETLLTFINGGLAKK